MPHKSLSVCSDDRSPSCGSMRVHDQAKHGKKSSDNKDIKKSKKRSKNLSSSHSSYKSHHSRTNVSKDGGEKPHSSKRIHVDDNCALSDRVVSPCGHDHKKKRKHAKSASKHEKRGKFIDSHQNAGSISSDSHRKHKHVEKPRELSKPDKRSHSGNRNGQSSLKSDVYECTLQSSVTIPREDECMSAAHIALHSPPHTPSSTPPCSSVESRASSYSHSSLHHSSKSRKQVQSSCVEKTEKRQMKGQKRSPNIPSHNKPRDCVGSNNHEVSNVVKPVNSQANIVKIGSSSDTSVSKNKRHESHALSYGYSQSSQRHHSPRHKHKHHSSSYRDRSRSDSQRNKSCNTNSVGRDSLRTKTSHTKSKSKLENYDDNHKVRHSKQSYRSTHDDRNSPIHRSTDRHRAHEATTKYSSSSSPKVHKQSHRSVSIKKQRSRSRSLDHSTTKRDNRTDNCDMSGSINRRDSFQKPSNSPAIKEKRSPSFIYLCKLLDELDIEELSDTDLQSILPSSLFTSRDSTNQLVTSSAYVSKSMTSKNVTQGIQKPDSSESKNNGSDHPQLNSGFVLESLEKLSNQIRQHMSGAESWDPNELSMPIDIESNYPESSLNQSVVRLTSVKGDGLDSSENPVPHQYTPWQYLIESAGKTLSLFSPKQPGDSITCIGSWIEPPECRQDLIPLQKRADGLEALHTTGVSERYTDHEMLNQTVATKLEGTDTRLLLSLPSTQKRSLFNRTSDKSVFRRLHSMSGMMHFTRKTDVSIRQKLLRTIKCI